MGRHQMKALALGQVELAARGLDEAEPAAQLAGPAGEAATLVEADAVILPRVRGVVEHAVHPLARVRAQAGQRDDVDVGRGETELAQQRVYRLARIAGVVLQPAEALFGCTADDLAVAQDRRGRTVGLGDAEDDHRDVILSHRPPRPNVYYDTGLRRARRAEPPEETAMTIDDKLAKAGLTVPN